ncbi:MAG: Ig-like domain-containing protein [Planctomycetota bacterium]|nr:Ig-like domain-containing protein [Planctomycetota bacterium]
MKILPSLSKILATSCLLAIFTACGSSSDSAATVAEFGLSVCSLGCNGSSFSTSTHAANQDITFTFNDVVDPSTVNFSSISIVDKATGVFPTGSFIVNGKVVVFQPSLSQTDAGTLFGFLTDATYRVQILDDASSNAVAAVSGRLNQTFITGDITIIEPVDLVPGSPSLIEISPDPEAVPTTRDFPIVLTFGDLMNTLQMANPQTGESTQISIVVVDTAAGTEIAMPGFFVAELNRSTLLTTVTFTPSVPYPGSKGGSRFLRLSVSQQISDFGGNLLSNPGSTNFALPNILQQPGTLKEAFADGGQEDSMGSTASLWAASAGNLNSGFDPVTKLHRGGGSGILGSYVADSGLQTLNTNGDLNFPSELLGEDVGVLGGFYPFTEVQILSGSRIEAIGANPLRLFSQGRILVDGVVDIAGASAPSHTGKVFATNEWENDTLGLITESPLGRLIDPFGGDDFALGGFGAAGNLGAGDGGSGGKAWYHLGIEFLVGDLYLRGEQANWFNGVSAGFNPAKSRFPGGFGGGVGEDVDVYCGSNAGGVGGIAPVGKPSTGSGANQHIDQDNGSGMGSWCWPPIANQVTDSTFSNGVTITTHPTAFAGGSPTAFGGFSIHRSRGGGGGGYWTSGARGIHFDATSTDPLGLPLLVPVIDEDDAIFEFNSTELGDDRLLWDSRLGGGASLPDADGGRYVIPANTETLNPELGLLLGGSGGGGAGMSEHGSIEDRFGVFADGDVGTYRNNPGGGGGAGGGAAQLHAGSSLSINGEINAPGGHGATSEFMASVPFADIDAIDFGPPGDAGGGGGSGGSILLQGGSLVQASLDAVNVNGGDGGLGAAGNHGGDGGSGLVRVETATGTESLSILEGMVTPNEAVELTPIGLAGQANIGTIAVSMPGILGDVTAGDGTVFNGNASGVRSRWYEPSAGVQNIVVTGWQIEVEYSIDGGVTPLTLSFSDTSPTDPDTTEIWIALQGGWMASGQSTAESPVLVTTTAWVIPSVNGATDGLLEINGAINRAMRFMIVFDHDAIDTLLPDAPGNYFRVTDVNVDFLGD